MTREQSRAADVAVFDCLDAPRLTTEIVDLLRRQVYEAWAEEEGYGEIEYDECGLATPPGVRLAAFAYSRAQHPFPMLNHQQVYNRLLKLEKLGLARRISLPSHSRSILWFRPVSATAEGLP